MGLAVQVFTINDCQAMLELIELEVDAIMTDRPLLLESLLNMGMQEAFQEYANPKPQAVMDEDKIIAAYPLAIDAANVSVVPVEQFLQLL